MLAANTFTQSKIVVMYKLVPVEYAGNLDELHLDSLIVQVYQIAVT